jgi:uncharacterized protein (TIGR03435 family)
LQVNKLDTIWIGGFAMKTFLTSAIALFTVSTLVAQNAPDQPKFEVASVKRTEQCEFNTSVDPGFVTLKGVPISAVVQQAFQVKSDQIEGPSWMDKDCFEVFAKIPAGVGKEKLPAMLKALLIERFKLAAHSENRLRSGYALLVDKDGPKLKESSSTSTFMAAHRGMLMIGVGPNYAAVKGSMSTTSLAHNLSVNLKAPVEDLTGLTGRYEIDITWAPDPSVEPPEVSTTDGNLADRPPRLPPPPRADIFSAIRDSLGLRLEPRKQQVEVIVVDHLERFPTEN